MSSAPWPAGEFALVTGASAGIGRELSLELAARGSDLMLCARRGERLLELKDEITARYPVSVQLFQGDLSRTGTVRDLLEVLLAQERPPSILINNAGRGLEEVHLGASPGLARMLLQLNIEAPFELVRGLLPGMVSRRRGWILNVSSIAGLVALPGHALYSASKHALVGFGKALSIELQGSGVSILTLCPGLVDTEFYQAAGMRFRPGRAARPADIAHEALDALGRGKRLLVTPAGTRLWSALYLALPAVIQRRILSLAYARYGILLQSPVPDPHG